MSDTPDPSPVSWNPPVPGSSWSPDPNVSIEEPVTPALDPAPPSVEPPKRRRAVAVIGAGALVAAGVFAVSRVAGGEEGGASSPEAAIERLVESLNEEDALGAMDVLLPGERRTFLTPMKDIVAELRRLDVLDDSADLGKVGGVDLEIELDDLDVDEVADDIVNVSLAGQASVTVDEEQLPLGTFIVDEMLDGERPDGSTDDEGEFGADDDVRITTVQRDGRWYVSLFYTIAESARGDADLPDPEDAIEPKGSESPEAAVEQMIDAITDLDLEDLIATLNPDEFEALQRYAPIFLDDAQSALDEIGDLDLAMTDATYDVESSSGGRSYVGFTSFLIEASVDGQAFELEWDGECMELTGSDIEDAAGCVDDEVDLADVDGDALTAVLAAGAQTFDGTHPIATAKVDGEWYVTFLGSFLEATVEALKGVEAGDLDDAMDQLDDVFSGGLTDVFDSGTDVFDSGTDVFDPETFPGSETDTTEPGVSGSVGGSSGDEGEPDITLAEPIDEASAKLDECYVIVDLAGAVACFQEGVDAGVLVESDIPAALRFQECGIAEGWWNFTEFELLDDAGFIELMTAANRCFQGHIDAGEMDLLEMPTDAAAPECWNGINPYLLDSDGYDAALQEYFSCSED